MPNLSHLTPEERAVGGALLLFGAVVGIAIMLWRGR